jgi:hypothetical protein
MPLQRMPDAADRRALIAYLKRHAVPDGATGRDTTGETAE